MAITYNPCLEYLLLQVTTSQVDLIESNKSGINQLTFVCVRSQPGPTKYLFWTIHQVKTNPYTVTAWLRPIKIRGSLITFECSSSASAVQSVRQTGSGQIKIKVRSQLYFDFVSVIYFPGSYKNNSANLHVSRVQTSLRQRLVFRNGKKKKINYERIVSVK